MKDAEYRDFDRLCFCGCFLICLLDTIDKLIMPILRDYFASRPAWLHSRRPRRFTRFTRSWSASLELAFFALWFLDMRYGLHFVKWLFRYFAFIYALSLLSMPYYLFPSKPTRVFPFSFKNIDYSLFRLVNVISAASWNYTAGILAKATLIFIILILAFSILYERRRAKNVLVFVGDVLRRCLWRKILMADLSMLLSRDIWVPRWCSMMVLSSVG